MTKAIFLDRDGVIINSIVIDGKPYAASKLEYIKILPNVKESLDILISGDWKIFVVTNQPDVARGIISKEDVEEINTYLEKILPITRFYTCYHDDEDFCNCRKPKPGFLISAALNNNIDLNKSYMIGDRWKDIEAGKRAGCKTFFIDYDYKEKKPTNYTYRVRSLNEAVKIIMGQLA
tara:strand:+ start:75 stop:605 length:531 start_codon:yes stop_codon:yes gene_type:complete